MNDEIKNMMMAELKANGINSKMVTIKHLIEGYNDVFRVTVRNADVSMKAVKDICGKYRHQRYDCKGEILEGLNIYIDFSRSVYPETPKDLIETVEKVLTLGNGEGLKWQNYDIENDGDFHESITFSNENGTIRGEICTYNNAEKTAERIFRKIYDRQ